MRMLDSSDPMNPTLFQVLVIIALALIIVLLLIIADRLNITVRRGAGHVNARGIPALTQG
jgi:hypothetical protein